MALANIPNELISRILFPIFDIPDEMFRDLSETSPFARPSHLSISSILTVSKKWMAVAIPLLYRIVILRSKAQAFALERILRKHKEFGIYIKKLRVEGGYGASMRTIITSGSNITDLCISLYIRSSDSVEGLCGSLSLINPHTLVVLDSHGKKGNKLQRELVSKVNVCLETWTNVVEAYLGFGDWHAHQLIDGLKRAPSLRIVTIPYSEPIDPILRALAKNSSLKEIRIILPHHPNRNRKALHANPRVNPPREDLIVFLSESSDDHSSNLLPNSPPNISPPSDPLFVPMAHVDDNMRNMIWDHILRLALDVELYKDGTAYVNDQLLEQVTRTRTSVPLVSKDFRRLSLPYIYGYPIFQKQRDILTYAKILLLSPSLGTHLRSLRFYGPPYWLTVPNMDPPFESITQIFLRSPQLTRLCSLKTSFDNDSHIYGFKGTLSESLIITWESFVALADTAGPVLDTLEDVWIDDDSEEFQSPSIFDRFSVLRSLRCRMDARFISAANSISPHSLSSLVSLRLWRCDSSFLDVLSCMDLPALRDLHLINPDEETFDPHVEKFLQIHGSKIRPLRIGHYNLPIFKLCPNITYLSLHQFDIHNRMIFHCLEPDTQHPNIEKVFIDILPSCTLKKKDFLEFCSSLDLSYFPSLREIQSSIVGWPRTEYDIPKNHWLQCAEVLDKQNVKLTDKDGCFWRPRLTM